MTFIASNFFYFSKYFCFCQIVTDLNFFKGINGIDILNYLSIRTLRRQEEFTYSIVYYLLDRYDNVSEPAVIPLDIAFKYACNAFISMQFKEKSCFITYWNSSINIMARLIRLNLDFLKYYDELLNNKLRFRDSKLNIQM